jgi:hypothetical protein
MSARAPFESSRGQRVVRAVETQIAKPKRDPAPTVCAAVPQLRPFFGFYGGKWRDALKHYPPPEHDTIIEPFAGFGATEHGGDVVESDTDRRGILTSMSRLDGETI